MRLIWLNEVVAANVSDGADASNFDGLIWLMPTRATMVSLTSAEQQLRHIFSITSHNNQPT
jgi:hypothetical protein